MTNSIKCSFLKNGEKMLVYRVRLVGLKGTPSIRSRGVSFMQQQQQKQESGVLQRKPPERRLRRLRKCWWRRFHSQGHCTTVTNSADAQDEWGNLQMFVSEEEGMDSRGGMGGGFIIWGSQEEQIPSTLTLPQFQHKSPSQTLSESYHGRISLPPWCGKERSKENTVTLKK